MDRRLLPSRQPVRGETHATELERRVLLVEDNPGDARLIREMLADFGGGQFVLDWCAELDEAFARLERERFDVFLLDLSLPASRGLATFTRAKEHGADVPVVVLTGLADQEIAIEAARQGAADYLVKGQVSGELLTRTLRYAIERHRAQSQLRQVQRLEAIGRLAGGVAHDFNNILLVILSYSELLMSELEPGPLWDRALAEIKGAAERGATLTRQLLAFSRQQVMAQRVLDLNEIVTDFEDMLRRLIGEDVQLRTKLESGLGSIKADRGQIEQVLMNLAVNARDAMAEHGALTIETSNAELDGDAIGEGSTVSPGSYVLLAVTDTGVGMDVETKRRIFEPFFSTKERGKGTGLGLSTVYGIVAQSGGHIVVDSEVGRGTVFKIFLPRFSAETASVTARSQPARRSSVRGGETVLLVEDDPVVRELSQTLLEQNGYRVLVAAGGAEACKLCKGYEGEIHLLITDVVMPGIGGPALAKRVTELRPDVRVLYLSGYTTEAVVRHGVLDPEKNFLQKPFSRAELLQKVERALAESSA